MRHDIPVKCKCSHSRGDHRLPGGRVAACVHRACGCSQYRPQAPGALARVPAVVTGTVERIRRAVTA